MLKVFTPPRNISPMLPIIILYIMLSVHMPRIISPMLPIIILYIMLKVFTSPRIISPMAYYNTIYNAKVFTCEHFKHYILVYIIASHHISYVAYYNTIYNA